MKEINLLPAEYIQRQNNKRKRTIITIILFCGIFVLIMIYLYVYFVDYNIKKELLNNASKITELNEMEEIQLQISAEQEAFENRVAILESLENQKINHSIFLENIEQALGNKIVLDNITYNDGNNLIIKGKTTQPDRVAHFMVNISKIEGISKVGLNNIKYVNDSNLDENFSVFTIQCTYKPKGGQNIDLDQ